MKKGVIEIQFNWIFVLIAGAIFLVFFGLVARGIAKSGEQSLDYEIINYLDGITTSLESSPLTEHSIELLDKEINVDCDFLSIKGHNFEGIGLKNKALFSPDSLKENITSYTLFWETPFKASYMMYATSPDVKYVIIKDANNLYEKLWNPIYPDKAALPKNIKIELVDSGATIEGSGFRKLRIITFSENLDTININRDGIKPKDISAIKIKKIAGDFPNGHGEVTFYIFKDNNFETSTENEHLYFNKASLIGAIYSETAPLYECNMNKAIGKMKLVAESLKLKSNSLNGNIKAICPKQTKTKDYGGINDELDKLTDIDITQLDQVDRISDNVNGFNKDLINAACPFLY
ncbi:MAG: hypothetical protein V1859_01295 [archaeon]